MKKGSLFGVLLFLYSISAYTEGLSLVEVENFDTNVVVELGFFQWLEVMERLAIENDLQIKVQQSFRKISDQITGHVVPPSDRSNHLVGHAIDINIVYKGEWYNSSKLSNYVSLPQAIKNFISNCKKAGMRWGGDFAPPDPVHFDDGINIRNRIWYDKYYPELQQLFINIFQNKYVYK